ncbi:MAG: TonB-dependent receptor domain-containing protein [Parabacteroides sp.]
MFNWLSKKNRGFGLWLVLWWSCGVMLLAQPSQSSRLTLQCQHVPITAILTTLEQQSGYFFSYESSIVEGLNDCSLQAKHWTLDKCLRQLLVPNGLDYQVVGQTIILRRQSTGMPPAIPLHQSAADTTLRASLDEVVVEAHNPLSPLQSTQPGLLTLTPKEVRQAPSLLGEPDLFKTLLLTPGVAQGTDLFSSLYVRGGDADQNLYWLDGVPLYQTSHLGGLFATFNTDIVKLAGFYKGSFPARYGERLSSVLDARSEPDDTAHYHGCASLGLIAGKFYLTGPLIPGQSSFSVAYRRTWLETFTEPAMAIVRGIGQGTFDTYFRYAFQDLNVNVSYRLPKQGQLKAGLYYGDDLFRLHEKPVEKDLDIYRNYRWRWGNLASTLRWEQPWKSTLHTEAQLFYSRFLSNIHNRLEQKELVLENARQQRSLIRDIGGRFTLDALPHSSLLFKTGVEYQFHTFHPYLSYGPFIQRNERIQGHEWALFTDEMWEATSRLRIQLGLRLSHYRTAEKHYTTLQPRLSARYQLRPHLSLKAAYAENSQYIHQVSENYLSLPSDLWLPTSGTWRPMSSRITTLGLYSDKLSGLICSMEAYYKTMDHLLDYLHSYQSISVSSSLADEVTEGSGRSYGVEWMVKKPSGRLSGWIGYTLSWTDRHFPELNGGKRFPARFDNRHKLNIVATYQLKPHMELTAAWSLSSGNWLTFPTEYYSMPNMSNQPETDPLRQLNSSYFSLIKNELADRRNNVQLPYYHRLDLSLQLIRPLKKGRKGIWSFGLYNAYCRMNPISLSILYKQNATGQYEPHLNTYAILPTLPSVSYTYQF